MGNQSHQMLVGKTALAVLVFRPMGIYETCNPGDRQDFHAVYVGRASGLPTRVRVLLDFLAARGQVDDSLRR